MPASPKPADLYRDRCALLERQGKAGALVLEFVSWITINGPVQIAVNERRVAKVRIRVREPSDKLAA